MSLTISDRELQTWQMSEADLRRELAILLFQQERLTLAQASRFGHLPQPKFQRLLAERQIPLHYDLAELHEDWHSLAANAWQ